MATTREILDSLPGFAGVAVAHDAFVDDTLIPSVEAEISADVWGTTYGLARAYLVAHQYTRMVAGSAAAGQVVSESVDGVSRSYASPAGVQSDGEISSTVWGQQFKALRDKLCLTPRVLGT